MAMKYIFNTIILTLLLYSFTKAHSEEKTFVPVECNLVFYSGDLSGLKFKALFDGDESIDQDDFISIDKSIKLNTLPVRIQTNIYKQFIKQYSGSVFEEHQIVTEIVIPRYNFRTLLPYKYNYYKQVDESHVITTPTYEIDIGEFRFDYSCYWID